MAWYYNRNNQQMGPVEEAAIKDLIAAGTINGSTMVWQNGMPSWQPAQATPLAALLPPGGPPALVPPVYATGPQASPEERVKQIRMNFMLYWILMTAGVLLFILIVGIPVLIAGVVFYCILLYRLWSTVQDGQAQSTPGKAVGFMFIPFFNLYWQFVAVWGLAKDLNQYARRHNIAAPPANETLALVACILSCCGIVPYLGIVTSIAGLIFLIIAVKSMCDTAVAIIQQGG